MQHSKVCTFMKACHIITDTVLMRESKRNNKKAQHMAAFEPTTSGSRGVCSTTALEPLPIALCLSWKQCYLMHSFLSFMAVRVDFSCPTNQKSSNEHPFVRKTLLEQRSPCREWKRTCSSCVALSVSLSLSSNFILPTHTLTLSLYLSLFIATTPFHITHIPYILSLFLSHVHTHTHALSSSQQNTLLAWRQSPQQTVHSLRKLTSDSSDTKLGIHSMKIWIIFI